MAGENQYSLADQVHLWAHLSPCPLEAPLAPEGPVAPEAQVVLLALDLPVWQNNTFQHQYSVILLDPLRLEPLQLNDNEERVVEWSRGWLWAASIHNMEESLHFRSHG